MAQGVADPANPLLAPAVGLAMPFSRAPSLNMNLDFYLKNVVLSELLLASEELCLSPGYAKAGKNTNLAQG